VDCVSTGTSSPPLVLIVEDEPPMRRYLNSFLSRYKYRLAEAATGEEALALAADNPPDLVLLDLGLPDMDGQDVLEQLREWLRAPIIVLSVRDQDKQKIMALDHGADDYLTKPFSTGELLARIQVAFRHAARGGEVASPVFECGELSIDRTARRVSVGGTDVPLTRLEYKLLVTLARHAGKVLTHQFLLSEVWGPKRGEDTQHLRVFMAGLRRKIESEPARPRYLLTEQGVGYRLASE
jgi:two-component system KDP operon response regulator KdpE